MTQAEKRRFRGYLIQIVTLCVTSAAAGYLFFLSYSVFEQADEATRKFLGRIAWISVVMLCVSLLLLVWVVTRWIVYSTRPRGTRSETQYVNAWALAGKRVQVDPAEDDGESDDDAGPEDSAPQEPE